MSLQSKLDKVIDESDSNEKLDVSSTNQVRCLRSHDLSRVIIFLFARQSENKRGSAIFVAVKKKFWSGQKNNNKNPPPLTSKKSSESLISLGEKDL